MKVGEAQKEKVQETRLKNQGENEEHIGEECEKRGTKPGGTQQVDFKIKEKFPRKKVEVI